MLSPSFNSKNTHNGPSKEGKCGGESRTGGPGESQASKSVHKARGQILTKRFAAEHYGNLHRVSWKSIQQSLQRDFPSMLCSPSITRTPRMLDWVSTSTYGSRPFPLPWFSPPSIPMAQGFVYEWLDPSISAVWGGRGSRVRTIQTETGRWNSSRPRRRVHDGATTR